MDLVLLSDALAGRTPAATQRAELVREARDAATARCDEDRRRELMSRLQRAESRASRFAVQRAVSAAHHLLEVVAQMHAPSSERFFLASSARMVGVCAESACGELTNSLTTELRAALAAPSLVMLQELAARSFLPGEKFRDPLHALVRALLRGPGPLAARLTQTDWSDESLARAFREATDLDVVLPLAALACEPTIMLTALDALFASWQPSSDLVPVRALRALRDPESGFVRAFAAHEIGVHANKSASLATAFRSALDPDPSGELLYWLQLFAESSQDDASASLKRYFGG
jgi:hypothetical protein